MARSKKPLVDKVCNGHRLRVFLTDGRYAFVCTTMPDLAAKYDGATDSAECVAEFERRASAGVVKVDEEAKGAA